MKKILFLSMLAFLLAGCSSLKPPAVEYRVAVADIGAKVQNSTCRNKSLKVAQAFSPSYLMSLDINYVEGTNKQFAYADSKWADTPNRFITLQVEKLLRQLDIFKSVQVSKSRSRSDLILETNIEEFMQYFNEDASKSYVKVSLVFSLIDSASNRVVASRNFTQRLEAKTLDAKGGVEALNNALKDALKNSTVWFKEVCR